MACEKENLNETYPHPILSLYEGFSLTLKAMKKTHRRQPINETLRTCLILQECPCSKGKINLQLSPILLQGSSSSDLQSVKVILSLNFKSIALIRAIQVCTNIM